MLMFGSGCNIDGLMPTMVPMADRWKLK